MMIIIIIVELSSSAWIMFLIFFYDTCPDYMKGNFFRLSNLHRYNTRGSNFNFQVPRIKTHSSGSFYYNAIANWNRLPDDIKSITLKSVFKRRVKTHLLNHMHVKLNFLVLMCAVLYESMFHIFQCFKGPLWK